MSKINSKKQNPILTVIGTDQKGIVAQISNYLWKKKINIEEIQQGIMNGKFFMVMSIDITEDAVTIASLNKSLMELGSEIGVQINVYDEAIFNTMHKI